jgi:hypothetical protein
MEEGVALCACVSASAVGVPPAGRLPEGRGHEACRRSTSRQGHVGVVGPSSSCAAELPCCV